MSAASLWCNASRSHIQQLDLSGMFFFEVDHDGHARNTRPLGVANGKRFDVEAKSANK
jgi:hypothetical protein